MKKYIKNFVNEEEGIETIEFIGLVAVAAALIAIIANLGKEMFKTAQEAETEMIGAINKIKTLNE